MRIPVRNNYDHITLGPEMTCNRRGLFGSIELTSKLPGVFTYLELGVAYAGTLTGVLRAMEMNKVPEWLAMGVDLQDGGWHFQPQLVAKALSKWNPDMSGLPSAELNRVHYYTCGSEDFLKSYDDSWPRISLALIDACHSAPCCTRDFILLEPLMKEGGVIMFHDADETQQGDDFDVQPHCGLGIGVRRAVQAMDLLNGRRRGWKLIADTYPTRAYPGRGSVFIQKVA